MIFLELFLAFFKIGLFTFGGAYGAIPIIRETVLTKGWLTEGMFSYFLGVAESTPGPIMVNLATYVGSDQAGIAGSAVATLGVILPSFIIILLIVSLLRSFIEKDSVQAVLNLIKPCIAGVILAAGTSMLLTNLIESVKSPDFSYQAAIIGAIVVGVSIFYKKVRKKESSPILLIVFAAVLGIIFYGY